MRPLDIVRRGLPPGPRARLARTASILLALLPPARMAWIVFSNGENNLSNDYVHRVSLVRSMLEGTCSLQKYLQEAWIGGAHSGLAIFPIYYLNARFFHWSVWFELGLGLALAAATLALLAAAIPRHTRWLLLPSLSLLLFSTSRVTVFTFGEPALQYGISQLGVAIGACAVVQLRERPLALATAFAFGGILASWSWGGGMMTWPVFAAALLLLRIRSLGAWAIFLGGAVAGAAQYVWPLFFSTVGSKALTPVSSLKIVSILDLLGRPFVNGIADGTPSPGSQVVGAVGVLMLAAMLVLFRTRIRADLSALLLVAWALLVALQIAFFRVGVAPWYVFPMALFWVGLLIMLADSPPFVRTSGILVVTLMTLRVQATWEDKSFYLQSRSPASASCLRNWRTAPAPCHSLVFQWGDQGPWDELPRLGDALEPHRLSVFGPRRAYLMQGDIAVGRVSVEPPNASAFFSRDGVTRADPNDFNRLDLVLAPGATVSWGIDLPSGVRRATFSTVVRAALGDTQLGRAALVSVRTEDPPVVRDERTFFPSEAARHLSVDLSSLGGKHVTLRLTAESTREGATPLIFEAPRVLMTLDPGQNLHAP